MSEFEKAVAEYLDCKRRCDAASDELDACKERLMELVGEGGEKYTEDGVRVSVTPARVNKRFDWKKYTADHPECKEGYMVDSHHKATLRVTQPKREELDEWGWEA